MCVVQYKPQFIFAVPRLFETIYRGVLNKFATEKPGKRKIINFFTKVTMAHVQATRTLRGLVIRDAPPSPIEKVGHSLSLSLSWPACAARALLTLVLGCGCSSLLCWWWWRCRRSELWAISWCGARSGQASEAR